MHTASYEFLMKPKYVLSMIMHMARRTVRGALRLDHVTAAQVIGRNYTAPVKKGAKYRVNLVYEDYTI